MSPFHVYGTEINGHAGWLADGQGQGETYCSVVNKQGGICPPELAYDRLLFHNYFHFDNGYISKLRIDGLFIKTGSDHVKPLFEQVFESWDSSGVTFTVFTLNPYNPGAKTQAYKCLKLHTYSKPVPQNFGTLVSNHYTIPNPLGDYSFHPELTGTAFNQVSVIGGLKTNITTVIFPYDDSKNTTENVIGVLANSVHVDLYTGMWPTKYDPGVFDLPDYNMQHCDQLILDNAGSLKLYDEEAQSYYDVYFDRTTSDHNALKSYLLAIRYRIYIPDILKSR